ncbi:MAG: hypothetical protein K6B38_11975 [Ruminococcus sp.]|nr:hypothetical protein [Ruminococcus sp.]
MNLVKINCPNCGAVISLPENSKFGYCEFCNSQLRFDDGSRQYRVADRSEIERILLSKNKRDLTSQIDRSNLEYETESDLSVQKWTILVIVFHALFVLLSVATCMFRSVEARLIATTIGIIMPIIFAVIKPRNARGSKIGVFCLLIGTFGFMLGIMNSIADRIF